MKQKHKFIFVSEVSEVIEKNLKKKPKKVVFLTIQFGSKLKKYQGRKVVLETFHYILPSLNYT